MSVGLKSLVVSAARSRVARHACTYYHRRARNVVFTHFDGDRIPPHFSCFASPASSKSSMMQNLDELSRYFDYRSLTDIMTTDNYQKLSAGKPHMAISIDDGMDFYDDELLDYFVKNKVYPHLFLITKYIDNNDLMWRHKLSAIVHMSSEEKLKSAILQVWSELSLESPVPVDDIELLRATLLLPLSKIEIFAKYLWEVAEMPSMQEYMDEYQPYLSWERVKKLSEMGFEFGSHSHTHPVFNSLSQEQALHEMKISREILQRNTGQHIKYFSYPFGILPDIDVRDRLHDEAGYDAYFGAFGLTADSSTGMLYHRISIEDGLDSVYCAPAYPVLSFMQRVANKNNVRA